MEFALLLAKRWLRQSKLTVRIIKPSHGKGPIQCSMYLLNSHHELLIINEQKREFDMMMANNKDFHLILAVKFHADTSIFLKASKNTMWKIANVSSIIFSSWAINNELTRRALGIWQTLDSIESNWIKLWALFISKIPLSVNERIYEPEEKIYPHKTAIIWKSPSITFTITNN